MRFFDLTKIAPKMISKAISPDLDPVNISAYSKGGVRATNAKRCFQERPCMKYRKGRTVQTTAARPFGFTTS